MPVFWSGGFPFYESWMAIAVIGGAIYLAVPILVLIAISTWWPRLISLTLCCVVPITWVCMLFLMWAHKPWTHHGEFPWWVVKRDLISAIAVALTSGWLYWRVANTKPSKQDAYNRPLATQRFWRNVVCADF